MYTARFLKYAWPFFNIRLLLLFSVIENATEQELKDLLSEIQVMKTVGRHINVVNLLGVSTQHGRFEIFRACFRKAEHVYGTNEKDIFY